MVDLLLIAIALTAALACPGLRGMIPVSVANGRQQVGRVLSRVCDVWSDRLRAWRPAVYGCLRSALGATLARPAPVTRRSVPWRWAATPPPRWSERRRALAIARIDDGWLKNCWLKNQRRTNPDGTVPVLAAWAVSGRLS